MTADITFDGWGLYSTQTYFKYQNHLVDISCVVQDSLTSGSTVHICTLPAYARPSKQLIEALYINGEVSGFVRAKTSGDIEVVPNRTATYHGFHLTYLV